ncbi:MAG: 2-dehydro-3-deoxygalactonokinase [Paracoccaceae bacterium]|nr:2-dehydro-3-deoxygalactonokinase [Paracoccaceae bacterium]
MTQDFWIGIAQDDHGAEGWRFDGARALEHASGPSAQDVMAGLAQTAAAVIVRDGLGRHPVPAPALPVALPLTDLTQDKPHGLLPATARLRIAGVLSTRPNWDGVICLPGQETTHWCQISANEVVSFQSALTQRLAQAMGAADLADAQALADTMSRPERLALHLRSASLMDDRQAIAGHLLGAELAAMRAYWLGQRVISVAQTALYRDALVAQGVPTDLVAPQDATREGLVALRATSH